MISCDNFCFSHDMHNRQVTTIHQSCPILFLQKLKYPNFVLKHENQAPQTLRKVTFNELLVVHSPPLDVTDVLSYFRAVFCGLGEEPVASFPGVLCT